MFSEQDGWSEHMQKREWGMKMEAGEEEEELRGGSCIKETQRAGVNAFFIDKVCRHFIL